MKIVKLVLLITIVFFLSLFIMQNLGKNVDIKFFSENNVVTVEIVTALFISLLLGALFGLLFSAVHLINTKSQVRVLKKEYLKLEKEVNLLRNKDVTKADNTEV